jgi:hypothetical protein
MFTKQMALVNEVIWIFDPAGLRCPTPTGSPLPPPGALRRHDDVCEYRHGQEKKRKLI